MRVNYIHIDSILYEYTILIYIRVIRVVIIIIAVPIYLHGVYTEI